MILKQKTHYDDSYFSRIPPLDDERTSPVFPLFHGKHLLNRHSRQSHPCTGETTYSSSTVPLTTAPPYYLQQHHRTTYNSTTALWCEHDEEWDEQGKHFAITQQSFRFKHSCFLRLMKSPSCRLFHLLQVSDSLAKLFPC